MHCQCNYVDVCQILNIGLPESLELATVGWPINSDCV
jgi:hypothetical protein